MHIFAHSIQHEMARVVDEFVSSALPSKNYNISAQNPVIFFHQRKAGGTSMREALHVAGQSLNMTTYLPCYDGIDCDVYTIGRHVADIYGGHFMYGELKHLLRRAPLDPLGRSPQTHRYTCFTIFREPIERLESCYYFRYFRDGGVDRLHEAYRCMNDVPNEILANILVNTVDIYGDNCLNEPFRIFSGIYDSEQLSEWAEDVRSQAFVTILRSTLQNLANCIVVVLNDHSSYEAAEQWMPQLRGYLTPNITIMKSSSEFCALSNEKRMFLTALVEGERTLYDAVLRRSKRFKDAVL